MQRGFLMHSCEWERRRILRVENCFRRRNRQGILAGGDGFAVDLPEGGVILDQLEAALAEGPDVHQSLDEGEEQYRRGLQVDVLADSAIPDPFIEQFLKAGYVFVDRLRGLFVQLSIAEADDLGDHLKGDPFAHADHGKVIPDDFLDGVEGNRFVGHGFPRDVTEKGLFDMAEQEGEDALLALEMAVDGRFGDANLCGNLLDRQVFAAVFENQAAGCIDDLLLSHLRVFPFFYHDSSPVKDAPAASRNAMDDTITQDGIKLRAAKRQTIVSWQYSGR